MTESQSGGPPTGARGGAFGGAPPTATPATNGRADAPPAAPAAARRGLSRIIVFPILILVIAVAVFFGYRTYYNSTHFVWTDNAQISGSIIQVGALNAGQVSMVLTDVGQSVQQNQVIARVSVPQTVASTASGSPKLEFSTSQNQVVDVTSPLSGTVVARMADPGSTVAPGQAIVAVVDPTHLYVVANVNETDVDRIQIGEPVDVTVDSLNVVLPGRVEAITRASAASFSLIPQSNSSGSYSKVVQVVPVRVAIDYGNLPLIVGSSVEVNIHVR